MWDTRAEALEPLDVLIEQTDVRRRKALFEGFDDEASRLRAFKVTLIDEQDRIQAEWDGVPVDREKCDE